MEQRYSFELGRSGVDCAGTIVFPFAVATTGGNPEMRKMASAKGKAGKFGITGTSGSGTPVTAVAPTGCTPILITQPYTA